MQLDQLPFNLDLLIPTEKDVQYVRPVTSLDIFEGKTKNFHPDGLFSTEIFGKVGDERRNRQFSYIDLKAPVFHPVVYKAISKLKILYEGILSGKEYALWDTELNDFVKSSPLVGETGYTFFLSHFHELTFEKRPSIQRSFYIELVEKYRENCMIRRLVVLPAGLRDFEYDDNGKPSKDEVNTFYQKALSVSNLVTFDVLKTSPKELDNLRYQLQIKIQELYLYFEQMLSGKKKLVLGKWASRKIFNGTRNVITSLNNDTSILGSQTTVGFNQTSIGLYQFLKASLPVSMYHIRESLRDVFPAPNSPALLVNSKTLKPVLTEINPKYYDAWMSNEGLEQTITKFGIVDLRFDPVKIDDQYLALIYRGPDSSYKIFNDIDELPEDRDPKDVSPITYCELFYLAVHQIANTLPIFFTRYPVINYGSIYPSKVFLKTTVKSEVRYALGEDWKVTTDAAIQFPVRDSKFVDSMSPHGSHLARLGADFDGDTGSGNIVTTEEAIREVDQLLQSRRYYVGPNGEMNFSASTDIIEYVLASITR